MTLIGVHLPRRTLRVGPSTPSQGSFYLIHQCNDDVKYWIKERIPKQITIEDNANERIRNINSRIQWITEWSE